MKGLILLLALAVCVWAQVKLPPYTRQTLPNGAVLYMVPKTGLPLVSFRVIVKGGAESDPVSLAGLSAVTAELLRRGAGQRSAAQFAEELDGLGGVFAAQTGPQDTIIQAEFLKKDFNTGLNLLADAALHPAFPPDEVRKTLARRADQLKSMKDNPGAAINSYYRNFFFGVSHPYGRVPDESSLDHIRRDDITAYHSRTYVGRNLIIVMAGEFDGPSAQAAITRTFGAVPAGDAYKWADDQPPARSASPRVLLIDKPDATQTYFIIAQPGVRHATPDRAALDLINELFGGRFTSMLNEELRINTGLTYGARANVEMSRLTGAIEISTYTRTETTGKAIDLALEVLKRLQENGITAEQLASAKAYLKGNYAPQRIQTADQIAAMLGEMELYGLGREEVDEFFSRVDAVTLEQANSVAKRYYRTDNLTFVLLGNAAKIREVAAKYGPEIIERNVKQMGWAAAK